MKDRYMESRCIRQLFRQNRVMSQDPDNLSDPWSWLYFVREN